MNMPELKSEKIQDEMNAAAVSAATVGISLADHRRLTPRSRIDLCFSVWQDETEDDECQPYDSGGSWTNTPDITLY